MHIRKPYELQIMSLIYSMDMGSFRNVLGTILNDHTEEMDREGCPV